MRLYDEWHRDKRRTKTVENLIMLLIIAAVFLVGAIL